MIGRHDGVHSRDMYLHLLLANDTVPDFAHHHLCSFLHTGPLCADRLEHIPLERRFKFDKMCVVATDKLAQPAISGSGGPHGLFAGIEQAKNGSQTVSAGRRRIGSPGQEGLDELLGGGKEDLFESGRVDVERCLRIASFVRSLGLRI